MRNYLLYWFLKTINSLHKTGIRILSQIDRYIWPYIPFLVLIRMQFLWGGHLEYKIYPYLFLLVYIIYLIHDVTVQCTCSTLRRYNDYCISPFLFHLPAWLPYIMVLVTHTAQFIVLTWTVVQLRSSWELDLSRSVTPSQQHVFYTWWSYYMNRNCILH